MDLTNKYLIPECDTLHTFSPMTFYYIYVIPRACFLHALIVHLFHIPQQNPYFLRELLSPKRSWGRISFKYRLVSYLQPEKAGFVYEIFSSGLERVESCVELGKFYTGAVVVLRSPATIALHLCERSSAILVLGLLEETTHEPILDHNLM